MASAVRLFTPAKFAAQSAKITPMLPWIGRTTA